MAFYKKPPPPTVQEPLILPWELYEEVYWDGYDPDADNAVDFHGIVETMREARSWLEEDESVDSWSWWRVYNFIIGAE
jgi:hypothetical protein